MNFDYRDDGSLTTATLVDQTFTGLDGSGASRTTTFNALNNAHADFGQLGVYSSGTVVNNYYNASNPKAVDDGVFNPAGSPDGYYSLGFAIFDDVLQFGGSLSVGYRARYVFHVDGTNTGEGYLADMAVGIGSNPHESFFAFDPGFNSAYWVTQSYEINGITPEALHVQFSSQFTSDCNLHADGATISGTSDFAATLKLTAIQVVDAQDNLVSGVTVTAASGTQYTLAGDVNGDGITNGLDIQPFVNTLNATPSAAGFNAADLNYDGLVDIDDVPMLVNMLVHAG